MSPADIALVCLILFGTFRGYRAGFLMELFSLAAIILGVIGGFKLMGYAIVLLDAEFDINKTVVPYVAFAVVFIAILIGVNLLGKLIKMTIDKTFLGQVDQAAGAGLGLLKAVFLLSVSLWILEALDFDLPGTWTAESWLLPRVEAFAPSISAWLADYVPFFRDVFT